MSLRPPDQDGARPPAKPKWYSYWPKWRRTMMAGALILLAGSIIAAVMGDDAPASVANASLIAGYGLLAYGFFLAMRARSEQRERLARSRETLESSEERAPAEDAS